jgi:hypothetical protein
LFYKNLSEIDFKFIEDYSEGIVWTSGSAVHITYDIVQSLFVKMASALDIIYKIAYEFEHLKITSSHYNGLSCKKELFKRNGLANLTRFTSRYDSK